MVIMKKIFYYLSVITLAAICLPGVANAQTPSSGITATATPTVSDQMKQIESLKDRLATKVAELNQSQRTAIYGTVKAVSSTTVTVSTATKDIKIELSDTLKVFQMIKAKRTALTTDDIAKNDVVTVFGNYDTTLDLLKGAIVFIQTPDSVRISGKITATNKTDYTITIETPEKKEYTIDFETFTKTLAFNGSALEKGGFSKLIVGDTIHVVGTAVPKKENRISATRILTIGESANTKGIAVPPSPTPTPTGEKEITPKPTLKQTP